MSIHFKASINKPTNLSMLTALGIGALMNLCKYSTICLFDVCMCECTHVSVYMCMCVCMCVN